MVKGLIGFIAMQLAKKFGVCVNKQHFKIVTKIMADYIIPRCNQNFRNFMQFLEHFY